MISEEPLMELPALKWASIISGWKKRLIILDNTNIKVVKSKTDPKKKNNVINISIINSKIIDEKKKRQFIILFGKKKLNFKVDMEADKYRFIDKVNEIKQSLTNQKVMCPSQSGSTINNNCLDSISEIIEISKNQMHKLLSDIKTMNEYIIQLKSFEKDVKKGTREGFSEIINHLISTGAEIQSSLSLAIFEESNKKLNTAAIFDHQIKEPPVPLTGKKNEKQLESSENETENFIHDALLGEKTVKTGKTDDKKENSDDSIIYPNDDSSDEEVPSPDDIKSITEIITESHQSLSKFSRNLSFQNSDFYDSRYSKIPNNRVIPVELKFSDKFIQDTVKSLASKNSSLPITYNEPISMLQKQCEKFYYSNLLTDAAKEEIPSEMKIVYIIGFLSGELSQSINRFLKPFNPILGETFEFFDNERKFRFFSEQVSHNPPISAYVCESSDFVFFGDTRFKSSFKILKGAIELSFSNKTHILFKKTQKKYVFNKPNCYLNGVVRGTQRYDVEGKMTIEDVEDKTIKAELNFYEDKQKKDKENILLDGDVYKGDKVVYKIKGSWKEKVFYSDDEGKTWKEIWSIHNEKYLTNTSDNYCLPEYSLLLNYYCDDLKFLPITDSRKRPDQREYEMGNVDKAIELKKEIEEKQRERHKKFDEDKIIYEPIYFKNIFDNSSEDFVYVYKGDYFEERKVGEYPHSVDIFGIQKTENQNN